MPDNVVFCPQCGKSDAVGKVDEDAHIQAGPWMGDSYQFERKVNSWLCNRCDISFFIPNCQD